MTRTRPLGVPQPSTRCSAAPHMACPHCGYCHEHEIDLAPDDWHCEHDDPMPERCDQCNGSGRVVAGHLAGAPVYADCFCGAGEVLPFELDVVAQRPRDQGKAITDFITKPPEVM